MQVSHVRPLPGPQPPVQPKRPAAGGPRFGDVLARTLEEVRFSQHAAERLRARGIQLGPDEARRLAAGVERAAAKGARDSLILLGDLAFIVSVKNRTVVTAVDGPRLREGVFTNIDSAVLV